MHRFLSLVLVACVLQGVVGYGYSGVHYKHPQRHVNKGWLENQNHHLSNGAASNDVAVSYRNDLESVVDFTTKSLSTLFNILRPIFRGIFNWFIGSSRRGMNYADLPNAQLLSAVGNGLTGLREAVASNNVMESNSQTYYRRADSDVGGTLVSALGKLLTAGLQAARIAINDLTAIIEEGRFLVIKSYVELLLDVVNAPEVTGPLVEILENEFSPTIVSIVEGAAQVIRGGLEIFNDLL